ncbi:cell division protein ZapA [Proteiniclasticum sp. QWL-01]|uniref:cell division protein ZapA n=1 Tax=Proteiniclasticum sp. QWL-01 TaxID=3036945 RepID=UPI00240F33DB|nr:cell division protein ZapA [Proteiniclasticum sp. QWL-01]WFF71524.1 cell division protein ZapA [Proteiniclasticum sp. QWL-01]
MKIGSRRAGRKATPSKLRGSRIRSDQEEEDEMNKVAVTIQGLDYNLVGEESEEHLQRIGTIVDELLGTMLKSNRKLNTSTAAILTSCNLVDEKLKLMERIEAWDEVQAKVEAEKEDLRRQTDLLTTQLAEKDQALAAASDHEAERLKEKDEEFRKLQTEMTLMQESVKEYRDDNEQLSKLNKELKFELQSYKYKVLDLQNKLFENQITPSKDKKDGTPRPTK